MPIARTHSLSRLPAQMSTRRVILTPAMRVARARGSVQRVITSNGGPQGATSHCVPGFCYDSQGQICCVKSGNNHLCVFDCFAYEPPSRPSQRPAWFGPQGIRARGPRTL